jgi:glycosyltransferase involved in cell wall biosynthesis
VAVNLEVADYLREQLPSIAIEHIPNGLTTAEFPPDGAPAKVELPRPLVLGCGFLGRVKRFHLTIEAVERLRSASLLLLGKGPLESELRREGQEKLGERFLIDAAPYEEMAGYYRAADVVTVPSGFESFGMVYLEAMASNRPVVATRDRNREAIVREGGELVDPTDTEAYSAALARAIDEDYGMLPRKNAEKFDWERIGPLYLDAIEKTIHRWKKFPDVRRPVFRHMGD